MGQIYSGTARIDSRDTDPRGHCRPSALLGHLQVAATAAAEEGGCGRELLLERYGAVWILARIRYELSRPLIWKEELTVDTWHRGGRAGGLYRDFDLFSGGKRVGQAVSLWVLMERESRRLLGMARVPELASGAVMREDRRQMLSRLRMPEELELAERRLMHYSDTDINGHVNNTKYADFACDAIRAERLAPGQFVSAMQINYVAECHAGDTIIMQTAARGETHFVRGMDETGGERFTAELTIGGETP